MNNSSVSADLVSPLLSTPSLMDVEYSLYNLHTGLLRIESPPPPLESPMGFGVETYDISDYLPVSCSVLKNTRRKKEKVKKSPQKNKLETLQAGCKDSQFYSLPFGQAVASMY